MSEQYISNQLEQHNLYRRMLIASGERLAMLGYEFVPNPEDSKVLFLYKKREQKSPEFYRTHCPGCEIEQGRPGFCRVCMAKVGSTLIKIVKWGPKNDQR